MVNYGIVYGLSAYGLADRLQIEQEEAQEFIDRYLERFPAVAQFMADAVTQAEEHGYVSTLFGRRRQIPEIRAAQLADAQARRAARGQLGHPGHRGRHHQGRDGARPTTPSRAAGLQTRCILQIHDELLFEGPIEEAERATEIARAEMVAAADIDPPLAVDSGIGPELAGREVVDRGVAVVLTAVVGGMLATQGPINSHAGQDDRQSAGRVLLVPRPGRSSSRSSPGW